MKVISKEELKGTEREVECPKGSFVSLRYLLEQDKMGYTLTHTNIPKGGPHRWHYKSHLETCLCISGQGVLKNLDTGEVFSIKPGVAYVLDKNDPHTFQALEDTVLICIFNPPLKGRETHKEDGSY